ncbi:MAG: YceI family protein [Salinivirgaceae bacterium]|nr:YceI family protein [Salinivirgaceae bacterium]
MKKSLYVLSIGVFALFVSCNQTNKQSKTESTAENKMVEMESGIELTACNHATKIYWNGSKPGGEHNGIIKLKEGGKFIVKNDELIGGQVIIDMNSIVNIDLEDAEMNAKLIGHLKSADFFNVDSFPEAKFVITKVEKSDVDGFNKKITGNLTMKNITHEIAFNANVKVNEGMVSALSEDIVLDRTKWNVNYGSKSIFKELKDKFINDEFSIKIDAHSM